MPDFLMAVSSGYIVAAIISALAFFMIYMLLDESNRKCRSELSTVIAVVAAGAIWPIAWAIAVKSAVKRSRAEIKRETA